jgi:hypothetical protein
MDREKMATLQWVRPRIVAQIAFNERTQNGHLRHSRSLRLRERADVRQNGANKDIRFFIRYTSLRVVLSRRMECPACEHDFREKEHHPAAAYRPFHRIAGNDRSSFSLRCPAIKVICIHVTR